MEKPTLPGSKLGSSVRSEDMHRDVLDKVIFFFSSPYFFHHAD